MLWNVIIGNPYKEYNKQQHLTHFAATFHFVFVLNSFCTKGTYMSQMNVIQYDCCSTLQ